MFITFEAPEGEILLTGNNSIPLVKYKVGDHGGVFSYAEMNNILKEYNINLSQKGKHVHLNGLYKLPFVHVYERSDFSVVLSGANIYPEEVREAIQRKLFEKYLTMKFTVVVKNDSRLNEYLEINFELRSNVKKTKKLIHRLEYPLREKIIETLLARNSEYSAIYHGLRARAIPRIVFWPYAHSLYFKPGIKQKWIKKT